MTERPLGVTDVAAGAGVAEFRTRERVVSGNTVVEQYVVPVPDRVVSFVGMVSTFRRPFTAVAGINVAALFNTTGSGVLVAVRRLSLQLDYITNSNTPRMFSTSTITTAPTGGTAHTPVAFDSAQTHNSSVVFLGAASADGTATTLTATEVNREWRTPHMHFPGAAAGEQVRIPDQPLVPRLAASDPQILREGEGLLVQMNDTGSTSASVVVNCAWGEFTL